MIDVEQMIHVFRIVTDSHSITLDKVLALRAKAEQEYRTNITQLRKERNTAGRMIGKLIAERDHWQCKAIEAMSSAMRREIRLDAMPVIDSDKNKLRDALRDKENECEQLQEQVRSAHKRLAQLGEFIGGLLT